MDKQTKATEDAAAEQKELLDDLADAAIENLEDIDRAEENLARDRELRAELLEKNVDATKEGLRGVQDLLSSLESGSAQAILEASLRILETAGTRFNIPGFYKGTTDSPEGFAKLAEHGAEIVSTGKGATLIDDKTVAYLPRHSTVYTASQTKEILNQTRGMSNFNLSDSNLGVGNAIKNQTNTLKSELSDVKQAINNIPGYHVDWSSVHKGIVTKMKSDNKVLITHHHNSKFWE